MQDSLSVNWSFFMYQWPRLVIAAVLGFLIAGAAYVLVTPLWEATAIIQIGQLGPASAIVGDNLVESPESLSLKMTRPTFIKAAALRAGQPEMYKTLVSAKYNGNGRLNVRGMNPSGLISVSLLATSPELAKQLTSGVVGEIIDEHSHLVGPLVCTSKSNTRPTRLIGEVEVMERPMFPRPAPFMALGMVLGAAFAALLLWPVRRRS